MNISDIKITAGTFIAIVVVISSWAITWGILTNRLDVVEKSQLTKEDVRGLLKENNTTLLSIIDDKIALAVQKKNNE